MKDDSFGRFGARLLRREGTERLIDLPVPAIRERFKSAGLLVLRGFEGGALPFKAFADRFTRRYLRDLGGSKTIDAAGNYIQSLVPAGNAQELHCENGRGPNPPDLLWFHCVTPARDGGETTFADGVAIWEALGELTQRLFLERRVKYTETLPPEQWRAGLKLFFLDGIHHLQMGGTTFRFLDNGQMEMAFVTPAVHPTRWGGVPAFTNSITGPYPGTATFDDDEAIPLSAMADIRAVHERVIEELAWQSGDILMIDNSRFMHGRRAFTDQGRAHLTLMGTANFD